MIYQSAFNNPFLGTQIHNALVPLSFSFSPSITPSLLPSLTGIHIFSIFF